jgi:hypothetical protein
MLATEQLQFYQNKKKYILINKVYKLKCYINKIKKKTYNNIQKLKIIKKII